MEEMYCSVCKTKLEVTGMAKLETLCEHVCCQDPSLKEKYQCQNPQCEAHNHDVCWNSWGDCYYSTTKLNFIDGLSGAFNSCSRQNEVEIYKHDDDKYIYCGLIMFKLACSYKSNKNGDILKRKWCLKIFLKNKYGYIHYISGIRMFNYLRKDFNRHFKKFIKYDGESKRFHFNRLAEIVDTRRDRRWWRRAFSWYISITNRPLYKLLQEEL